MSDKKPPSPEDEAPKKFRITRKRLGTIRFVDPKGEFGFIEAEDFRDDVFFHHSVWDPTIAKPGGPLSGRDKSPRESDSGPGKSLYGGRPPRPAKLVPEDLVTMHVEFEVDDEMWESEQRLRAVRVQPTRRPMGRKLSGRDATFKIITHHPKARRKRPDWRDG